MNTAQLFLYYLYRLIVLVIFIRILLSWFGNPRNQFTIFFYNIADPILNMFRSRALVFGGIDLSPIVAIIVIEIGYRLLNNLFGLL